jgi:hypothetical protein
MVLTPTSRRSRAVVNVLAETKGQPVEVQTAAIQAVIRPPDGATANRLWVFLVGGLTLTVVVSAVAVLVLLLTGTAPDAMITVLSTVFAGLVGLFAGRQLSPTGSPQHAPVLGSRNGG